MKLTALEILAAKQGLENAKKWMMPVGASLRIARIARKVDAEAQLIEAERGKLILKYGEPGENGQTVLKQDSPNWPAFVADLNALLAQEVEIEFEPVELPATLEVQPGDIIVLEKFLA